MSQFVTNTLYDLSSTAKVFIAITIIECVEVIALTAERIVALDTFGTNAKAALIICLAVVFMCYFALNGVISENKFELVSYLLVTLIISFGTIYTFFLWKSGGSQEIILWIFCPLNFILGWLSYKAFGWKVYHMIGADINLQEIYTSYQIFLSLLKIDLLFGVGLVLGIGLFQLDEANSVTFYLDLTMLPITIGWAMLGWFSVRHESRAGLVFFLAFAILEPIYLGWKAYGWSKLKSEPLAVAAAASGFFVILRIVLTYYSLVHTAIDSIKIKSYKNFEKGLKGIFEKSKEKPRKPDPIETQPILRRV